MKNVDLCNNSMEPKFVFMKIPTDWIYFFLTVFTFLLLVFFLLFIVYNIILLFLIFRFPIAVYLCCQPNGHKSFNRSLLVALVVVVILLFVSIDTKKKNVMAF